MTEEWNVSRSYHDLDFSEEDIVQLCLLRSLEIDELVDAGLLKSSSRFDDELLNTITFESAELGVLIQTGNHYPACQLDVTYDNRSLPRLTMDGLRIACRILVADGEKHNNYEAWSQREQDEMFDYHKTALEIMRTINQHLADFRSRAREAVTKAGFSSGAASDNSMKKFGLKNDGISEKGIDISALSLDTKPSQILNKLPEEICAMIPENLRVLHVESVLRNDLYSKFLVRQEQMFQDLKTKSYSSLRKCVPKDQQEGHDRDTPETLARHLTAPKMTFHGTSTRFVPSIIRHGFLAPGAKHPETHQTLPVRCGSTYGQGIYSSPSAEFSLSYSGTEARPTTTTGFWGMKLFVCATIMGRTAQMTREDEWWLQTKPFEGADSHVGNYNMEYIVFDSAQILPCYVIHLDWGNDNVKYFEDVELDRGKFVPKAQKVHTRLLNHENMPGDRQRQKAALVAKAAKYFPYGYGPAIGTRFVVEEVGEVDEDEEDYGDYQGLRGEKNHEGKEFWEWDEEEDEKRKVHGSSLDEYSKYTSGRQSSGLKDF